MRVEKLFRDLEFVGQVEGDRRTYFVFKGADYLLVSANGQQGFNVSIVDAQIPELIRKKFAGQRVTRKAVAEKMRRPDLFTNDFSFLNALYVMAGCGSAKKLVRRDGRAIVFKIRGARRGVTGPKRKL